MTLYEWVQSVSAVLFGVFVGWLAGFAVATYDRVTGLEKRVGVLEGPAPGADFYGQQGDEVGHLYEEL